MEPTRINNLITHDRKTVNNPSKLDPFPSAAILLVNVNRRRSLLTGFCNRRF